MHSFIPGVTDEGPARAAPNIWPYPGHGSVAENHARENGDRISPWRRKMIQRRKLRGRAA